MTESGLLETQSIESQPVQASQPVIQPAASEERLFKQSEVNDIVKRAKLDAMRVAQDRPDYAQQKTQHIEPDYRSQSASQTHNNDEVRRIAAEEAQRLRDQWVEETQRHTQDQQAQKIVQDFFTKLSTGKEKYSDFDETVGDVDFKNFPNVVHLLTGYVDNAEDVMYSLGKDRIKMANLEGLARMSPQDAVIAIKRLSQSLRDNQAATKSKFPNEPLSQLKPSTTGTDTGILTTSDYRKKYRV
jgi:hypothetical protein